MAKQLRAGLVHDGFCLGNGKIKFLGQDFKPDTINKPPLQNRPVPLGVPACDPTVDVSGKPVGRNIKQC